MTKKNKDENNDERKLKLDDETLRRIVNLAILPYLPEIERWFNETGISSCKDGDLRDWPEMNGDYTDEFKGEFE